MKSHTLRILLAFLAGFFIASWTMDARQAEAQERMAVELNQIKQIMGSWDWENPDDR